MKKLLIAMSAAGAFALCASAIGPAYGDTEGFISGTTFSALEAGTQLNKDASDTGSTDPGVNLYWSAEEGADLSTCIISNAASPIATVATGRPKAWENDADEVKYLSIDIDKRLSRNVNPLGTERAIGDGLYFDSLVQFTATDTLPTVSEGDKLVVWLYGGEEDSEDVLGLGAEKVSTNLVVTAGLVDGKATSPTNYVVTLPNVTVEPNSWHRLTIKAYANITEDGLTESASQIGGFVVYIDGVAATSSATKGDFTDVGGLTAAASALGAKLFPSLAEAGAAAANLTCVAFEGTGAVDDLTFTTTDPFPEAAAETFTLTVTAPNGAFGLFSDYECQSEDQIPGSSPWTLPVPTESGAKLYASFTPDTGYNFVSATLGNAVLTPEEDGGTYYFELDISGVQADSTLALVITTTNGEVVPTFALTLTQGTGTSLSAIVDAQAAGAMVESNKTVTITATISDATTYENLVVTVNGVTVTLDANNQYSFVMEQATTVATSASEKQQPSENWATGEDLDAMGGKSVEATYGITGDLANADAKVFTTWASGVGGVAYADKGTTTYNVECFLLNIANNSSAEDIAAAKATAEQAIKITAISVDNGVVTITAPTTYGNGKVVVQGSVALTPASWHAKAAGDYFFRTALVVNEVE